MHIPLIIELHTTVVKCAYDMMVQRGIIYSMMISWGLFCLTYPIQTFMLLWEDLVWRHIARYYFPLFRLALADLRENWVDIPAEDVLIMFLFLTEKLLLLLVETLVHARGGMHWWKLGGDSTTLVYLANRYRVLICAGSSLRWTDDAIIRYSKALVCLCLLI